MAVRMCAGKRTCVAISACMSATWVYVSTRRFQCQYHCICVPFCLRKFSRTEAEDLFFKRPSPVSRTGSNGMFAVLTASLSWEMLEQMFLWEFCLAEAGRNVVHDYELFASIVCSFEPSEHPEVLWGHPRQIFVHMCVWVCGSAVKGSSMCSHVVYQRLFVRTRALICICCTFCTLILHWGRCSATLMHVQHRMSKQCFFSRFHCYFLSHISNVYTTILLHSCLVPAPGSHPYVQVCSIAVTGAPVLS